MNKQSVVAALGLTILTVAVAAAGSQLLLRNISEFMGFDKTFQGIFAQIKDAQMHSPVLIAAGLSCVFWFWSLKSEKLSQKKWLLVLLGVAVAAVVMLISFFLTTVNGILFWDVLISLIKVFSKGGLQGL
ncbi:MAG: hypothetical protein IJF27_06970 [Oscillospiraceae bacterium]|nr:hypothetical protein [Oscillospiraceae bacterium]